MDAMEWGTMLQSLMWPLTALVGIVSFFVLFREQIQAVLSRTSGIELDARKRQFKVRFGQQVAQAKARAKGIEEKVADSRSLFVMGPLMELAEQTARDVVLAAWGALKQIVYDACTARKIPLTPVTRIPEAVRRLAEVNAVNAELVYLINVLYQLGQELADDAGLKPTGNDAAAYQKLISDVVDWLMLSVISPGKREELKRQPTMVDRRSPHSRDKSNFPQPSPSHPAALLVGISRPVQGRQFPLDKEQYRLGREADNDVRITGDDYVSGHHASLRYEKGSLFLSDQGSRNGTFLNEKKVVGIARVQCGDQIRLGGSIFQVQGQE